MNYKPDENLRIDREDFSKIIRRYDIFEEEEEICEITQEPLIDQELSQLIIRKFQEGSSPYEYFASIPQEEFPLLDEDLISSFVEAYKNGINETQEIFELILNSCSQNCELLVNYGIMNVLVPKIPESLGIISQLLQKSPKFGPQSFEYNSGLYKLAEYSFKDGYDLIVSEILALISKIELEYLGPITPPITFDQLINMDDETEYPDYTIHQLLSNLMKSDNEQAIYNVLRFFRTSFKKFKQAAVTLGPLFYSFFDKLVSDERYSVQAVVLLSYVLRAIKLADIETVFHLIDELFQPTNHEALIESGLILTSTCLKLYCSKEYNDNQFDKIRETEIIPKVFDIALNASFKLKQEALNAIATLVHHIPNQEMVYLFEINIIRILCDFTENEADGDADTLFLVVDVIRKVLTNVSVMMIPDEEKEGIKKLLNELNKLKFHQNERLAQYAGAVYNSVFPYYYSPEDDQELTEEM